MPVYEYFCRTCNVRYDKLRPTREADAPITCPTCNQQNSVRTLSVFIMHTSGGSSPRPTMQQSHGGGCCGGTCGCASKN